MEKFEFTMVAMVAIVAVVALTMSSGTLNTTVTHDDSTIGGHGFFSKDRARLSDYKQSGSSPTCTAQYDPVCGTDGNTYSNSCYAVMNRVMVDYDGECGSQGGAVNSGKITNPNQNIAN